MTTDEIVSAARRGFTTARSADAGTRSRWLSSLAETVAASAETIAADITADTGKPPRWARIEVERAESIIRLAASAALDVHPQAQKLDAQPSGVGRLALVVREPRGPVLALSPFNFPLHLAVHKLAPAIAAGASAVLVPSPRTPRTAQALRRVVSESLIPDEVITVLDAHDGHEQTWELIHDPGLPVISFTGSDRVGWRIVDAAPRKTVVAELGGNAAAVIAPDYLDDADLRHAADRIATFAFYNAGQACTSPQRVYVPRPELDRFVDFLSGAAEAQDLHEDVGPVIDDESADRLRTIIDEALTAGARLATGGGGEGRLLTPTVLVEPSPTSRAIVDELFGPVVSVLAYDDIDDAFIQVNNSRYGLSAGIFTHDIRLAFRAAREFDVGQVVVGDVPTFRSDVTPFGGQKESGRGREGVAATIEDYTAIRTVVLAEAAL